VYLFRISNLSPNLHRLLLLPFHLLTHICLATSTSYPLGPVPVAQSSIMVSASAQPALQERHTSADSLHSHRIQGQEGGKGKIMHDSTGLGPFFSFVVSVMPVPSSHLLRLIVVPATMPSPSLGYKRRSCLPNHPNSLLSDVSNHPEGVLPRRLQRNSTSFLRIDVPGTPLLLRIFSKTVLNGTTKWAEGSPPTEDKPDSLSPWSAAPDSRQQPAKISGEEKRLLTARPHAHAPYLARSPNTCCCGPRSKVLRKGPRVRSSLSVHLVSLADPRFLSRSSRTAHALSLCVNTHDQWQTYILLVKSYIGPSFVLSGHHRALPCTRPSINCTVTGYGGILRF
jgi:hypothetical protein